MVNDRLRETAELMRYDLLGRRLRVSLIRGGFGGAILRSVESRNPEWYRRFCAYYSPANRRKPRRRKKTDTYIKRAHTLRALKEIASGRNETEYAERLMPFVERVNRDFRSNGWRIK